jgi:para-nitrobenzyl esterase
MRRTLRRLREQRTVVALDVVTTTHGRVRGVAGDGPDAEMRRFRGIPYAAPPTGQLRWAPPAEAEGWNGVRPCTEYAPGAIQQFHGDWYLKDGYRVGYYGRTPPMSEDCLYLNIATAARAADERRPVFIWFHGGGLTSGFTSEAILDPTVLVRKGVVVVTVGQRLNLFGYLALPQQTAEAGRSGNYGLMDQLKALDWIRANIAAFGGDPENITVGGQSGGSQKAAAMVSTPHCHGQIRRVVSQSGLKWMQPFATPEWARDHGVQYLEAIGLPADTSLDKLRAMDADALYGPLPRSVLPDYMVQDGELLPFPGFRESFDAYAGRVDFLSGTTLGEADLFARVASQPQFSPNGDHPAHLGSAAELYAHYKAVLGDLYDEYRFEELIRTDDANAWVEARCLATLGIAGRAGTNVSRNLMLDRLFGVYMRRRHPGTRAYTYLWSYTAPVSEEDYGTVRDPRSAMAWHGSETWYTFASLRPGIPPNRTWRQSDFDLAEVASSYWANFIRSGNPNGPGLPEWPASHDDFGYIDIGQEITGHTGLSSEVDRLVRDFVLREYELAIDPVHAGHT